MSRLEILAQLFDKPLMSGDHQHLAETAWIGGPNISVRYWLGRLIQRNLFRESDQVVENELQSYLSGIGYTKGALLVRDFQAWDPIATLLQHEVNYSVADPPTKNERLVKAIRAILFDPERTDLQLAKIANTTEKQIARMSDIRLLRKLWKLRTL